MHRNGEKRKRRRQRQRRKILGAGWGGVGWDGEGSIREEHTSGLQCGSGPAAWGTDEDQAVVPVHDSPGRASGASAMVSTEVHYIGAARLPAERCELLKREWCRPNGSERVWGRAEGNKQQWM